MQLELEDEKIVPQCAPLAHRMQTICGPWPDTRIRDELEGLGIGYCRRRSRVEVRTLAVTASSADNEILAMRYWSKAHAQAIAQLEQSIR